MIDCDRISKWEVPTKICFCIFLTKIQEGGRIIFQTPSGKNWKIRKDGQSPDPFLKIWTVPNPDEKENFLYISLVIFLQIFLFGGTSRKNFFFGALRLLRLENPPNLHNINTVESIEVFIELVHLWYGEVNSSIGNVKIEEKCYFYENWDALRYSFLFAFFYRWLLPLLWYWFLSLKKVIFYR